MKSSSGLFYKAMYGKCCIPIAIWAAILYFQSPQPSTEFILHTIEFLGTENIPLGTKIIFLAALEMKIWLFVYFSSHLGLFKHCLASALKKSTPQWLQIFLSTGHFIPFKPVLASIREAYESIAVIS